MKEVGRRMKQAYDASANVKAKLELAAHSPERDSPRGPIALPIRVESQMGLPLRMEIRDISSKGLAIYSDQDVRVLMPLKVVISVPYSFAHERNVDVRFDAEILRMEEALPMSGRRYLFVLRLLSKGELNKTQLERLN